MAALASAACFGVKSAGHGDDVLVVGGGGVDLDDALEDVVGDVLEEVVVGAALVEVVLEAVVAGVELCSVEAPPLQPTRRTAASAAPTARDAQRDCLILGPPIVHTTNYCV